jgi:diguanylate cyclase (GGDEF)-like protein
MLDMDHFSAYNTAHGHPGGDRLLKACGAAWRAVLRGADTLARCGGEEFGVLLPETGRDEALAVIQRVRAATPDSETCSAGIAEWDGSESAGELVARADEALYAAKMAGRDRTVAAPGREVRAPKD